MTNWNAWTNCPCGTTHAKTRTRSVKIPLAGAGKRCKPTTERGICTKVKCDCSSKPGSYGDRCENRDCVMGSWSSWSTCKGCPKCDGIYNCPHFNPRKSRSRSVRIQKEGNGRACGSTTDSDSCGYRCVYRCYKINPYAFHVGSGFPLKQVCQYVAT